jgi:hypothetical protein
MRAAPTLAILALLAGTATACHQGQQQAEEQNISIDDATTGNGIPANADVETLPPDESSETSSTELQNGQDNPDVNDVNASTNSY